MVNGGQRFVKNVRRSEDQRILKVRNPKVVKLRVGVTAGRDPVDEKVSVVGNEIAVENERIEIVAGNDVGKETGGGAVVRRKEAAVRRKEAAVGREEAEVRGGEAEAVIGISEGIQEMCDVAEVESDAEERGVGRGDVVVVEKGAGTEIETEIETVEGAIAEVEAVRGKGVVGVMIDVAAEVDPVAEAANRVTGTVWSQIDRKGKKNIQ